MHGGPGPGNLWGMAVWIVTLVALAMILVEWRVRARPWARVRGWVPRALALNGVQFATAWLAARTWEAELAGLRPWTFPELGSPPWVELALQAAVGYVAITFVYYWWHRARHGVGVLWRFVHQVHHSPARIEILTSFYKHPLEVVLNSLVSASILAFLVGIPAEPAALAILATGLAELFYHWNVRTPRWLGYFIQRPEMHCVHHQRGVHAGNYADLPLWDLLFGTFVNPASFEGECGFGAGAEARLAELLAGREVA